MGGLRRAPYECPINFLVFFFTFCIATQASKTDDSKLFKPTSTGWEGKKPGLPCSMIWCSPSCNYTYGCSTAKCTSNNTCTCSGCSGLTTLPPKTSIFNMTPTGWEATTEFPCTMVWCNPSCNNTHGCSTSQCSSPNTCTCSDCPGFTTLSPRISIFNMTSTGWEATTEFPCTMVWCSPSCNNTHGCSTSKCSSLNTCTCSGCPGFTTLSPRTPIFTMTQTGYVSNIGSIPCSMLWCDPSCKSLTCSEATCNSNTCRCSSCTNLATSTPAILPTTITTSTVVFPTEAATHKPSTTTDITTTQKSLTTTQDVTTASTSITTTGTTTTTISKITENYTEDLSIESQHGSVKPAESVTSLIVTSPGIIPDNYTTTSTTEITSSTTTIPTTTTEVATLGTKTTKAILKETESTSEGITTGKVVTTTDFATQNKSEITPALIASPGEEKILLSTPPYVYAVTKGEVAESDTTTQTMVELNGTKYEEKTTIPTARETTRDITNGKAALTTTDARSAAIVEQMSTTSKTSEFFTGGLSTKSTIPTVTSDKTVIRTESTSEESTRANVTTIETSSKEIISETIMKDISKEGESISEDSTIAKVITTTDSAAENKSERAAALITTPAEEEILEPPPYRYAVMTEGPAESYSTIQTVVELNERKEEEKTTIPTARETTKDLTTGEATLTATDATLAAIVEKMSTISKTTEAFKGGLSTESTIGTTTSDETVRTTESTSEESTRDNITTETSSPTKDTAPVMTLGSAISNKTDNSTTQIIHLSDDVDTACRGLLMVIRRKLLRTRIYDSRIRLRSVIQKVKIKFPKCIINKSTAKLISRILGIVTPENSWFNNKRIKGQAKRNIIIFKI